MEQLFQNIGTVLFYAALITVIVRAVKKGRKK